ncbi:hypothetical protein MKW92_045007, partial [Papaver armeniacum]
LYSLVYCDSTNGKERGGWQCTSTVWSVASPSYESGSHDGTLHAQHFWLECSSSYYCI